MSEKYKAGDPQIPHFITIATVGWVDLFIRSEYKEIVLESLKYCQKRKGLIIHAWVIMTSHLHMMISSEKETLSDIVRDFKKYTSKQLITAIQEIPESRKEWILKKFAYEAGRAVRGKNYKLWQDGYHPIELSSTKMIDQRIDYIHNNPVKDGFVLEAEHYTYSSAIDYCGGKGKLVISFVD